MLLDTYLRAAADNKKRDDFLHQNGTSKQYHEAVKSEQLLEKKMEKYDYFPFTHGYEIERKQKELNLKRKHEKNQTFQKDEAKRAKRLRGADTEPS